jgi:hypothetical protein
MMSFKTDQEATAQQRGKAGKAREIPEDLIESYIIDKTGWDILTIRATPVSVLNNLLLYYHLDTLYLEASNSKK